MVISEDGSSKAVEVISEIFKKTIQSIHRREYRPDVIRAPFNDHNIVHGNLWKSRNKRDYPKINAVCYQLADFLSSNDENFVLWHFDGDTVWSERHHCENHRKFNKDIIEKIRAKAASHDNCSSDPLSRLFLVVPFYSIESWLYVNIMDSLSLVQKNSINDSDREFIQQWKSDPSIIDEVPQIKDKISFGSNYNLDLAKRLKVQKLQSIGKSFSQFHSLVRSSSPLEIFTVKVG